MSRPGQRFTQIPHLRLVVILMLYLLLATTYSIIVPIGRGADEWAHYWYARFIADHRRLPLTPAERETAGYKSDWPPLYHLAAAAVTGWVDTAGPPDFKYRAGNFRRGLVPAFGPEAILHTEDELFPWQQEVLVWHLGRFLSIIFSAGTLLVTYLIALEVFANSKGAVDDSLPPTARNSQFLALAATAVLAFNPRFLFTGMLFNYDSLTLLLSSLFVWLAIRIAKGYDPRWGFWGLGALAGLALVTKYLAALLPLVILFVAWVRVVKLQGAGKQGSTGAKSRTTRHTPHVLRSRFFWNPIGQAATAYVIAVGWWFVYLIINFNEIDTYGLVLGTLAPLIRGDASDRTVEFIFAWLSGGQAPPPAYIEKQTYTAWQILAELPTTFWGIPINRPYPLNWFIVAMTGVAAAAIIGLFFWFYDLQKKNGKQPALNSQFISRHSPFAILLMTILLPVPFMLVRLFGARDALEAVQGRHILFLAGPAVAILLVLGISFVLRRSLFAAIPAVLLTGAIAQLIYMQTTYPPPAPVRTTVPPASTFSPPPSTFSLPGGAQWLGSRIEPQTQSLRVSLFWRGGDEFAPEDYRVELQLTGEDGPAAGWSAYQTQARYPPRAWEPGDTIRDTGYLPLAGLPAGDYTVHWRILGKDGPLFDWQALDSFTLPSADVVAPVDGVAVWRDGVPVTSPPPFIERETVQLTFPASSSHLQPVALIGPDGKTYPPALAGETWASFIIAPYWPSGDYTLSGLDRPLFRIAGSGRNFHPPAELAVPVDAVFEGKIKLLGYTLPARRVQPGDGLPVTLYWQGLDWIGENLVIFARLLDNQQVARGGYDRLARENYSTLLWAPGEIITDGFAVPVEADAPDGVYTLSVGWYRRVGGQAESLPLVDPQTGQPAGQTSVTIGPVKVGGPPPGVTVAQAQPEHPANVVLGDQIQLLGFDMSGNLQLTLYWQALRVPDADYTVFVHIRNAVGEVVAQKDRPPVEGVYPTGLWDAGEIIPDRITIPLDGLSPGRYTVVVGLYELATGQRLPVEGTPDGAVQLEHFEYDN